MLGCLTAIVFVTKEDFFHLKLHLIYWTLKAQLYSSRLFYNSKSFLMCCFSKMPYSVIIFAEELPQLKLLTQCDNIL